MGKGDGIMLEFKRVKQELLSKAKIVSLYKDYLENPDGKVVEYDLIKHNYGGGAGALVVDSDEYTYLVRQYRNSLGTLNLEIPAGGYSYKGEDGEECARREIEEELGLIVENMYHVSNVISSVGTFDEKTDIYIGLGLKDGIRKLDEDEFIEIVKLKVDDAVNMIYNGEIIDSKTIIALLAYNDMKKKGII